MIFMACIYNTARKSLLALLVFSAAATTFAANAPDAQTLTAVENARAQMESLRKAWHKEERTALATSGGGAAINAVRNALAAKYGAKIAPVMLTVNSIRQTLLTGQTLNDDDKKYALEISADASGKKVWGPEDIDRLSAIRGYLNRLTSRVYHDAEMKP
jgi:hypothetical protein